MSKVVAQKTYLIATAVGNMKVTGTLLTDYDIDDMVHDQSMSQCRLIQLVNLGREINANAYLPPEVIPAIFKNNDEELV